ncbi:MAG: hypothetical protein UT24_C0011G0030 [Candidatus Woesebacteria bacterium GW2011_GWB1_39_12]|uniref:Uncharacterized protein n=1 Tax=Candidatus Woesebacteria bacterium GW2011_GWB1_39_12 TaxID=1618574 RepID=A0A0G0QFR6_9BACT|nr:MAG: hypothetical protein UT24_C0011G0030 [Candidatus Woesebacteria bacterium GW2011_GWB1_39_12]
MDFIDELQKVVPADVPNYSFNGMIQPSTNQF